MKLLIKRKCCLLMFFSLIFFGLFLGIHISLFCFNLPFAQKIIPQFNLKNETFFDNYSNIIIKNNNSYKTTFLLDITDDLSNEIDSQLGILDNDFDDIVNELNETEKSVFKNDSFFEKIKQIISGKEAFNVIDIFSVLGSVIIGNFSGLLPLLALIAEVAIVSSLLLKLRGKSLNKPLGDIIHFACFAVIVVTILSFVLELVKATSNTLSSLKNQMEITFPILLTLMASLGASASVSIYQPLVAILCGAMMWIFTNVLLPIFSLSVIFGVIGNLTSSVKMTRFTKFLQSLFKYVIGFSFTIFLGFTAISGIAVGSFDGVSIRATKFAIKSYLPIVGGYISDGFSIILASSVLIKNAIGYSGLIVMFLTVISPVLKIVLCKLGLSLVSGIIESIADERITDFVSSTAKSLSMLSSVIITFSFAYLICVGFIMCSANIV